MKRKGILLLRISAVTVTFALAFAVLRIFHTPILNGVTDAVIFCAGGYLPSRGFFLPKDEPFREHTTEVTEKSDGEAEKDSPAAVTTVTSEAEPEAETTEVQKEEPKLSETDGDIKKLIKEAKSKSEGDKKDGDISDYKYVKDGVTDSYGKIRVKNVNKTNIDIKQKLDEKLDLSIKKDEPAVLIYHTHTTETYQLLDRDFYAVGCETRTSDEGRNMVRVGKAICEEIEKAGYKVIHVTDIHDQPYSGAYSRSRSTVEEYLKKYPSIQITLDIHRDAIQLNDGTKIAPTAEIDGKKAAQIMIISGCQEEGNGITNLPDWQYNLTFGLKLQQSLEESFPGITRPLYFCPRSYNMNMTHCSLLVEMGSDANTLEEAVYTGKCLGVALTQILEEYEE